MARFDNVIVGGGLAAGMVAQEYRGGDGDGSVLLIGRDAPQIRAALEDTGIAMTDHATLEEATRSATAVAQPGDAVLLSPACASFDQFADFEQRGDTFRRLVRELA